MRTLDSIQEERSKAATLRTVPFLVITTYSDRDAKTAGDVFYISDHTVNYKWEAGAERRFLPWLLLPAEIGIVAPHIPHAANSLFMEQTFSFTLNNGLSPHETGGTESYKRVIELLRENYPLEGATVEFAQLLIDSHGDYYPLDLTAYDGNEHTPIYSGRVAQVGPITEATISFSCVKDSPEIAWNRAEDPATAPPRDLGMRYPRPYGAFTKMPLVMHTGGWVTTLAQSISATQTSSITITDGSGLGASGNVSIDGEEMAYSAATDTTITISSRGQNAAAHNVGSTIIELISEMILVAADEGFAPINDITNLYVLNPFNGELVRVTTSYEFEDSDSIGGLTLSTVKFSLAQLRELYEQLYVSAMVSVQPSYGTGAAPTTQTKQPSANGAQAVDPGGKNGIWTKPADVHWDFNGSEPHRRWDEDFAAAGFDNSKDVLRWRLTISVENTQEGGGAPTICLMTMEDAVPGIPAGTNLQITIPPTLSATDDAQSSWFTPPAGTYLSSLHSKAMSLITVKGTGPDEFDVTEWGIEAELDEGGQIQQDIPAESIGGGLGYNHQFFADGEGATVPDDVEFLEVYDFDDATGWNADAAITRSTESVITYEDSTSCQKLIFAAAPRIQCESADSSQASNWNSGANADVDDETTSIYTEGSGSIKGSSTSAANSADIDFTMGGTVDLTAGEKLIVLVDIYLDKQGASGGEIQLCLGNDSSNYDRWDFDESLIADQTWVTICVDYEQSPDDSPGSFSASSWDFFRVIWNTGTTQVSGYLCYVDFVRTIPKYARIQKNDLPTTNMNSVTPDWQFALRVDADAKLLVEQVEVYCSDQVGSGTTEPSSIYNIYVRQYDENFGAADAWRMGADFTAPASFGDETAIETIGVELMASTHGIYSLIGASGTLYVDTLDAENYPPNNYDAAVGALIEKPTDIFVHWCEEIGGVTVETVSLAASLTNLGSDKLAVDMRGLTPGSWVEGLAGLAYHSRANIVPAEAAAGTVYKMLTAESDYEWPTEDRELTSWQAFSEVSLTEFQIFTRWACLYAYNPVQGNQTDENYSGFLRADEDSNDLSDPATGEIQTAVDKFGNSEAPVVMLLGIDDEATAKDIFGYYVHEGIRGPRMFAFDGCPWWEVYDLEVGDIVSFDHPWGGATLKARVLSYVKNFASEANRLRCLEVS